MSPKTYLLYKLPHYRSLIIKCNKALYASKKLHIYIAT